MKHLERAIDLDEPMIAVTLGIRRDQDAVAVVEAAKQPFGGNVQAETGM